MDIPDPYLPGAISLLDQLDKKILVILRDGRTLIGYLRTIDQFANLVLHEALERIHVDKMYGDIQRGIFVIRGENVVLAGEIDEEKEKTTEKKQLEETRNRILKGSGRVPAARTDIFYDET
ncbi:unnamed protein product [Gongylonema pulchrum]|uniref:U6 snRNA-associated Sm-like protein LSm1 n=1 Tax=Gongylonema pulchrum TaxID=637853 RepID=A0A183D4R0_9BILA|nr:unnamed protein product [Gongylonema pulchrum]